MRRLAALRQNFFVPEKQFNVRRLDKANKVAHKRLNQERGQFLVPLCTRLKMFKERTCFVAPKIVSGLLRADVTSQVPVAIGNCVFAFVEYIGRAKVCVVESSNCYYNPLNESGPAVIPGSLWYALYQLTILFQATNRAKAKMRSTRRGLINNKLRAGAGQNSSSSQASLVQPSRYRSGSFMGSCVITPFFCSKTRKKKVVGWNRGQGFWRCRMQDLAGINTCPSLLCSHTTTNIWAMPSCLNSTSKAAYT